MPDESVKSKSGACEGVGRGGDSTGCRQTDVLLFLAMALCGDAFEKAQSAELFSCSTVPGRIEVKKYQRILYF